MIKVNTRSIDKQFNDIMSRKYRAFQRQAAEASFDAAAEVHNHFITEYAQGQPTGEVYKRGNTGFHTASLDVEKAEYPALDYGDLGRATVVYPLPDGSAEVASKIEHAVYLHFGTRSMQPRKSVIDAAKERGPAVLNIFARAAGRAARA